MENLILGIATLLFTSLCLYFSWKYKTKGNYSLAILSLMLGGLLLRLYTSTDFYLHEWDERYHALVAKNMIQQPFTPTLYNDPLLPYDYKSWTSNAIWVHKQPLPLWTMAASMSVFGVNEIALRLPSIVLSTVGIWLVFFIATYFFSKRTAYFTAFLFAINGLILELTGGRVATDHYDVFFMFFITIAVYFSILYVQHNKISYTILISLSLGLAILTKWLPALIVIPIWFLLLLDSKKYSLPKIALQFIIIAVVCTLVFLPWQLYIFNTFPLEANWEASYNLKHITEVLEEREGSWYFFLAQLRINYGELIYLPLIWFFWMTYKNRTDKKPLAILVWIVIPLLFFSLVQTKMQAYILFTCPALFMITAEFYYWLYDARPNHKLKWFNSIILILLIILPIRYTIERIKPFEIKERNPQWVVDLRYLNKNTSEKMVLFNYNRPVEAMFYTELTVYPTIPDKKTIKEIQDKGYTIMLHDDGNIPKETQNINGVKLIKLSTQ
jgi:4-amino-4-deoxy-L-arabinose transferase-like glycosyltransferase